MIGPGGTTGCGLCPGFGGVCFFASLRCTTVVDMVVTFVYMSGTLTRLSGADGGER
jgi:hypothetical protein